MTLQSLYDTLGEDTVGRIAAYVDARAAQVRAPWYVQSIVALGAWVAAVMFVAVFMLLAGALHPENLLPGGAMFIIVAVLLSRSRALFVEQFALALSVAGHLLLFFWVGDKASFSQHGLRECAALAVVLAAVLYLPYRSALHRYLSVLNALLLVAASLLEPLNLAPLIWVEAALVLACMTATLTARMRPLAYAACTALPLSGWLQLSWQPEGAAWNAISQVLLTLWLLWICRWAAAGWEGLAAPALWLRNPVLWAVILLGWVGTPPLLAACGLLVLGFGRQDRALFGLGIGFVIIFLFQYYYTMNITLLAKSWILIGSGVTLLAARSLLLPAGGNR